MLQYSTSVYIFSPLIFISHKVSKDTGGFLKALNHSLKSPRPKAATCKTTTLVILTSELNTVFEPIRYQVNEERKATNYISELKNVPNVVSENKLKSRVMSWRKTSRELHVSAAD